MKMFKFIDFFSTFARLDDKLLGVKIERFFHCFAKCRKKVKKVIFHKNQSVL